MVSNQWILLLIPFICPGHWWFQLGNSLWGIVVPDFSLCKKTWTSATELPSFLFSQGWPDQGENSGLAETRSTLDFLWAADGHVNRSPLCPENTQPWPWFLYSPLIIHHQGISPADLWACSFLGGSAQWCVAWRKLSQIVTRRNVPFPSLLLRLPSESYLCP